MKTYTTKITATYGEYRIRLFMDGIYQAGADAFEADITSAKATAAAMVEYATKNQCESDKTTDFAKDEAADYAEESGEGEADETVLYDVCNDYSLSARNDEPADIAGMEITHDDDGLTLNAFDNAVAQFLAHIEADDKAKYGVDSLGWGKLSDFAVGVTMDETRIYVSVKE
jgi:hypothetical protein